MCRHNTRVQQDAMFPALPGVAICLQYRETCPVQPESVGQDSECNLNGYYGVTGITPAMAMRLPGSSQRYPSPEAAPDRSITVYFGPKQPGGVPRGNWIQTVPGKSFMPAPRLYSPLEPLFDKSWRPSEVELVD